MANFIFIISFLFLMLTGLCATINNNILFLLLAFAITNFLLAYCIEDIQKEAKIDKGKEWKINQKQS